MECWFDAEHINKTFIVVFMKNGKIPQLINWLKREYERDQQAISDMLTGGKREREKARNKRCTIRENIYKALFLDEEIFPIIYDGKEDLYVEIDTLEYIKKLEDFINQ